MAWMQERQVRRQADSRPLMEQLHEVLWPCRRRLRQDPHGKGRGYALRQWETLQPFLSDGQVRIDNNHTEQTLRPIALGRKTGSSGLRPRRELAGHPPDPAGSCALAGITDPWTYLRDVLTKLARGWPQSRLGELVPTAWLAAQATQAKPA